MLVVMRHPLFVATASVASLLALAGLGLAGLGAQSPAAPEQGTPQAPSSTVAVERPDEWWHERHEQAVIRAGEGKVDLVFVGDSITQGWEADGEGVWNDRYAPRNAINLGFSGDRTQHVLWRLNHGEIDFPDGTTPKLAIVMIGTNNSHGDDYSANQIAGGIERIVQTLRSKLPRTKVLLLAIFPRGEKPNPQRDKNAIASDLASKIADGKMIHYLDIGPRFMNNEGVISSEVMPDFLHLSSRGYEIWADAIEDKVRELMEEPVTAGDRAPPASRPG
jgi:beta-glucosidase